MLQRIIFDALLELFDISTKVGIRMCSFLDFKAHSVFQNIIVYGEDPVLSMFDVLLSLCIIFILLTFR
jgi:hypothetical protein